MGPGLLESRIPQPGAQRGQDRTVVGAARHVGVQPAAAGGVQQCAGRGEQDRRMLRVILQAGDPARASR